MPIKAVKYEEKYSSLWDSFVSSSINGTIFHKRRFLDYHPKERFVDDSILFFSGNHLVAVFPAVRLLKEKFILKSHAGSSYGGIIVNSNPGISFSLELVDALIEYANLNKYDSIEFRIAEKIFNRNFAEEIDFAYLTRGFFIESSELSTYIKAPRSIDIDEILDSFLPNARRNTKKALTSGYDIKYIDSDDDILDFWTMLKNNLIKHNANPTHSYEELLDLKRRFPEEISIIGVYKDNILAAGITAFVCNDIAAHCFYFASRPEYQPGRPLNLAVFELIRHCSQLGLKYINFGISTEKSGKIINSGLFRFKESFGGSGAIRNYWIKNLRSSIESPIP